MPETAAPTIATVPVATPPGHVLESWPTPEGVLRTLVQETRELMVYLDTLREYLAERRDAGDARAGFLHAAAGAYHDDQSPLSGVVAWFAPALHDEAE